MTLAHTCTYIIIIIVSAHVLKISLRYRYLRYALSLLAIFVKNQTLLVMYPNTAIGGAL